MVRLRFADHRIWVSRTLSSRPEHVWNILTDTCRWPQWGPSVTEVESTDRFIRAGTTGRVKTVFHLWLPFTTTSFIEMQSWGWKIGAFKATGHTVSRTDDGSCVLTFDMPWWAFLYIPTCWLAIHRIDSIAKDQSAQTPGQP